MEWKQVTPEEMKGLKFATNTGRESQYASLFEAVAKGPVRIDVEPGGSLQALKWRLSRAIKKAGAQITVSTLADKSGVVVSKQHKDAAAK